MHLRNKSVPGFLLCFVLSGFLLCFAQTSQPQQGSQSSGSFQPSSSLPSDVDGNDPALPVWLRRATAAPSTKGADTSKSKAGDVAADQPIIDTTGKVGQVQRTKEGYVLKTRVENVNLPVTVVDQKQHMVTDLKPGDFTVYENNQPQEIIRVDREDIPVSIGILVDNSGSMRDKRQAVAKAVLNLVKASNPQDEVFVVNFNDEPFLDQDFTNNLSLLHDALDRLDSRGGTALYDAVIASADHLAKAAKKDKKVLLVITDGEDNLSQDSLEEAIRAVQDEKGPSIYTIGVLGNDGKQRRARRALEGLSFQTGGVAFFPKSLEEVDAISQAVAHDIRNQYTITYKPSGQPNGEWRAIKVVARASGRELSVRTKNGYFAGAQQSPGSKPQAQK